MSDAPKSNRKIAAADDSGGSLTYGVELEFVLAAIPKGKEDPDPDITDLHLCRSESGKYWACQMEVFPKMLEYLRARLPGLQFTHWKNESLIAFHGVVLQGAEPKYDTWRLMTEYSISKDGEDDDEIYQWVPMELTSPIMNEENYEAQVKQVCDVLKTIRINLSSSTSVHVHVGRGDDPFRSVYSSLHISENKKFLARDFALLPDYLNQPSQQHLNAEAASRDQEVEGLMTMMMASHVPEDWTFCTRGSVGFSRFQSGSGMVSGNFQTFEWRQMFGSFDAAHINAWVKVCMKFTDFCRLSTADEFKAAVTSVLALGEGYTGIRLLEDLLKVDTEIFRTKMSQWESNPDFCKDRTGRKLFENDR
ncbi:hypothetical protein F4802DRAFT_602177 [Xylaria palmicola]|nr:hypothetical protein F4802DRAFT_602177 [Xylaria palmicola]